MFVDVNKKITYQIELFKIFSGVAFFVFNNVLYGSLGYNVTALFTAFRAQVNQPVSIFYKITIMLNSQNRVSLIHQASQDSN